MGNEQGQFSNTLRKIVRTNNRSIITKFRGKCENRFTFHLYQHLFFFPTRYRMFSCVRFRNSFACTFRCFAFFFSFPFKITVLLVTGSSFCFYRGQKKTSLDCFNCFFFFIFLQKKKKTINSNAMKIICIRTSVDGAIVISDNNIWHALYTYIDTHTPHTSPPKIKFRDFRISQRS